MQHQRQRFCPTTAKISLPVVGLSVKVVVFRFLIWDTAVLLFPCLSSKLDCLSDCKMGQADSETLQGHAIWFGRMFDSSTTERHEAYPLKSETSHSETHRWRSEPSCSSCHHLSDREYSESVLKVAPSPSSNSARSFTSRHAGWRPDGLQRPSVCVSLLSLHLCTSSSSLSFSLSSTRVQV